MDRVKFSGIVRTISVNFFTAPEVEKSEIYAFVVANIDATNNSDAFRIVDQGALKRNARAMKERVGIQTFNTEISIDKGQYLAIRFAQGAGKPYTIEGNECYTYCGIMPDCGQCLEFKRCRENGIAMSFEVQLRRSELKVPLIRTWYIFNSF